MEKMIRIIATRLSGGHTITIDTNRPLSSKDKMELFFSPITRKSSQFVLKEIGPIGRTIVKNVFRQDGIEMVSIKKYQIQVSLYPAFVDSLQDVYESLIKTIKVLLSSPKTEWQEAPTIEKCFSLVSSFEAEAKS